MICKNCGAILNDNVEWCTNCGVKIDKGFYSTNGIYQYNEQKKIDKKRKLLGLKVLIIAVLFIVLFVVVINVKAYRDTKVVQELYDSAYAVMHANDTINISEATEKMVNSAYNQSKDGFVDEDVKAAVELLKQAYDDYVKLDEVNDLMTENPVTQYYSANERMANITSEEVKDSEKYKNLSSQIEEIQFQLSQKLWAEDEIASMEQEESVLINTIKLYCDVNTYTGMVYYTGFNENNELQIAVRDYDGVMHNLCLASDDEDEEWNSGIDEFANVISSGKKCVIAAYVAKMEDGEKIFYYSCQYAE